MTALAKLKGLQANTEENRQIIHTWRRLGLPVEWRFDIDPDGWRPDITKIETIHEVDNFSLWYRIAPDA